jgi:hypothetical protein
VLTGIATSWDALISNPRGLTLIIWLNGAFGSGKTTLTEELHRRLPDAVIFDPEYVGYVLTQAVPAPTGDFQDLPHHVFLDVPADTLESRIRAQVLCPSDPERDERARQFRLKNLARQPVSRPQQEPSVVSLFSPAAGQDRILQRVEPENVRGG